MTVVIYVLTGKIYKFKVYYNNLSFTSQFFLRSISKKCHTIESKEVSFKGNVYDSSIHYESIDKSDISNMS